MSEQSTDRWSAEFWDERYRSRPALWSGEANPVVVAETTGLPVGRALDVGCGEGGDALWLARQGWSVDGVDVSGVALARAGAHARDLGVEDRTNWWQRDILIWAPESAAYDLVSLPFVHLQSVLRPRVYGAMAGGVKPGGSFLVVAHGPEDLETTMPRPPEPDLFFTAQEIADLLGDDWEVVTCEQRPRPGTDPDGRDVLLHDTVLRAVRL